MDSSLRYLDRFDIVQAPGTDSPRLTRDQSAEFVSGFCSVGSAAATICRIGDDFLRAFRMLTFD